MVPIFGDQGRNAHMLARHGGALVLHKFDLENAAILSDHVHRILLTQVSKKRSGVFTSSECQPIQSKRTCDKAHRICR
uniref:Glucuronosyltransferase n=1 Tax=Caenorhabditis japonica TaxID=281687 RepID=A0A8R1I9G5_CAEJA